MAKIEQDDFSKPVLIEKLTFEQRGEKVSCKEQPEKDPMGF